MKTQFLLPSLVAALLFGAGCQSPVSSGVSSRVVVTGDRIVDASLKTDNPGVARHVALSGATTRRLPDGRLQVQALLESTDHRDYAIQYLFRWFDESGMEPKFAGERPWMQATIHGGEIFRAEAVSPIPNPSSFVVELRSLR